MLRVRYVVKGYRAAILLMSHKWSINIFMDLFLIAQGGAGCVAVVPSDWPAYLVGVHLRCSSSPSTRCTACPVANTLFIFLGVMMCYFLWNGWFLHMCFIICFELYDWLLTRLDYTCLILCFQLYGCLLIRPGKWLASVGASVCGQGMV